MVVALTGRRLWSRLSNMSWDEFETRLRQEVSKRVDVTLCGRFYERFADHGVSVARRVIYLVTGERPVPAQLA